ncbi:MAG: YraN family protein [Clostridiales Family XIII bacterium]|jgi:putative endonuclease|nr:YraN family protein [Clostridiales Family XIII bacterium]
MPKPTPNTPRGALGLRGEHLAARHLAARDYRILVRNYECRAGEIDIIAWQPTERTLCFVEVKCRRTGTYGTPALSVTRAKRRHIRQAAAFYLLTSESWLRRKGMLTEDTSMRFDVIGVRVSDKVYELEHLEGAFWE